jgi:uncharacterized membrane protein
MNRLPILVALCAALVSFSSPSAFAATAQQEKMKSCNADAKTRSLAGDERKAFMKECLSGSGDAAAVKVTQQEKMKTCNADAKTKSLAGDERKTFMKECLSAK